MIKTLAITSIARAVIFIRKVLLQATLRPYRCLVNENYVCDFQSIEAQVGGAVDPREFE